MSLCSSCMREPVWIKGVQLGKRCYNREWRKSQGPGSKYRTRAALSSHKRKVSSGAVRCGEVPAAPLDYPQAIGTGSPQGSSDSVSPSN